MKTVIPACCFEGAVRSLTAAEQAEQDSQAARAKRIRETAWRDEWRDTWRTVFQDRDRALANVRTRYVA